MEVFHHAFQGRAGVIEAALKSLRESSEWTPTMPLPQARLSQDDQREAQSDYDKCLRSLREPSEGTLVVPAPDQREAFSDAAAQAFSVFDNKQAQASAAHKQDLES